MGEAAGDEGGRTVAAAVESERRFMSSRSMAPSLFVDSDMVVSLECSGNT